MYRLTILYAPEDEEYAVPAKQLGDVFTKLNLDVVVKAAKDAAIPDILAADIVVFGSSVTQRSSLHPHFAEMLRAFEGINLAGKLSGFLSYGSNNAPVLFRKALRDTDISEFNRDLIVNSRGVDTADLESWAKGLYEKFREGIYE
jgi:hypothetical protein